MKPGDWIAKPKGHPAAGILHELADVADWHPEPWREFEVYREGEYWDLPVDFPHLLAFTAYNLDRIRRNPRTKRIGNYDVPLPEREAPKVGTEYWVASADSTSYRFKANWYGDAVDHKRLSRGLIHLDPESAETHGRALASLMQEDEE